MEQEKKIKNAFFVRLYDAETVRAIGELIQTGWYASINELMNCAIGIGIEKIYLGLGKRRHFSRPREIPEVPALDAIDRVDRQLKKVRLLTEDMFILMNSIEALTASVFNVQRAAIKGEELNEELLDSGYLAALPDTYLEIKDNLVARFRRKLAKERRSGANQEG